MTTTPDPWAHAPLRGFDISDLIAELDASGVTAGEMAISLGRFVLEVLPQQLTELLGALERTFSQLDLEWHPDARVLHLAGSPHVSPEDAAVLARWFQRIATARAAEIQR